MKKKGLESFFYVLLAGVGIFIGVALLSLSIDLSALQEKDKIERNIRREIESKGIYYFDKFIFQSFTKLEENKKTIKVGEKEVGKQLAYILLKHIPSIVVSNGLFEKNKKIIFFNTTNARKIRISFDISRTNRYGKLVVKLNEKIIYENLTYAGERVLLEIENSGEKNEIIKKRNILEISCTTSLPRIWAPTKYEVTNLRVESLDYIEKEGYVEFEILPEEHEGLKYVELKFNVLESNPFSPLSFILNGKNVFSSPFSPQAKPYVIRFYKKDNIKKGINVLRLETERSAYYHLSNIELSIYYLYNMQKSKGESTFYLKPEEYTYIDKNRENLEGIIEVKTQNVYLDKGIIFFINGAKYTLYPVRKYGKNILVFDVDLLQKGENFLRWETSGSYDIEYIKVGVREKDESKQS